jgi:prepilin-type N-terminal cleavage/methylation domain-containing protein
MLKKTLRNQKGFTLIEIIAVLVILGILAAVAIPRFFNMQAEARNKTAQQGVAAYQSSLSMAYASNLLGQVLTPDCNSAPSVVFTDACKPTLEGSESWVVTSGGSTTWAAATRGAPVTISVTYGGSAAQVGNWTRP